MIILAKLKTILLSIIIVSITIGGTVLINNQKIRAEETIKNSPSIGYTVILDAGHGGIDPGSIGRKTKVTESELNLAIVNRLEKLLLSGGIDVVKTRKDGNGLYGVYSRNYKTKDMQARKDIILSSDADLMISIHMNSFTDGSHRGAQVFYTEGDKNAEELALSIQSCFLKNLPESNRGISNGDYYILKCAPNIPSVLCECGYLSNSEDETLLCDPDYQERVAYSIYTGIVSYLNFNT